MRAGNSISSSVQKDTISRNSNNIKPQRFSHQSTSNPTGFLSENHAAPDGVPSTQNSSSRFPINHGQYNNGFGAMSTSSQYVRNNSPAQIVPSSGGYMGQGLGMVGFLEPTGSEANSTSFYSNNTSVNIQQNSLNNSRYLLNNRRENKIGQPLIGKVMPTVTKSIDGYQSNFPVVGSQRTNPMPQKNGSFYSS